MNILSILRKNIKTLIILAILFAVIWLTLSLTQKSQDIRPKAEEASGPGNLLLSAGTLTTTVGASFDVLVSVQLTDETLSASATDFVLLYESNLLEVKNVIPKIPGVSATSAFTNAEIVSFNGDFDQTHRFLRVSILANKASSALRKGTVPLATVTFRARNSGNATIQFIEENKYLEIAGIYDEDIIPTVTDTPTTPTVTPSGPTVTPSPTPNGGVNVVGYVWRDERKDAVKDGVGAREESVLANVRIKLRRKKPNNKYETVASVVSNDNTDSWNYTIYGLRPGYYRIAKPNFPSYKVLSCGAVIRPEGTIPNGYFICMKNRTLRLMKWNANNNPPFVEKEFFHVVRDMPDIKVMIPLVALAP